MVSRGLVESLWCIRVELGEKSMTGRGRMSRIWGSEDDMEVYGHSLFLRAKKTRHLGLIASFRFHHRQLYDRVTIIRRHIN